jgi:HEAT repeat protein
MKHILFTAFAATLLSLRAFAAEETEQDKLIALLKSDAAPAEKAPAFKRLAIIGNEGAVAAVAPYLADPKLASWSRISLEAIPGPAADDALRASLATLQGNLLIGAINSLGVRRDAKSVDPLVAKLADQNPAVVAAAAYALGRIGGDNATAALTKLLGSEAPEGRAAAAEGLIVCAEGWLKADKAATAVKLYDAVRKANVSRQRTLEATRGAIVARGPDGLSLLADELASADLFAFNMALRTARELPGRKTADLLVKALNAAAPERKAALLLALSDRGDKETFDAALAAAKSGPVEVRTVAMDVLVRTGNADALPVLLAAAMEEDAAISRAAKTGIALLRGKEVDAAIVALLKKTDPAGRKLALELIGQRQMDAAVPALLEIALSADESVRAASFKALGELANADRVPALIELLNKTDGLPAAETALRNVVSRSARPSASGIKIQKAVYGALPDGKQEDVTRKVSKMLAGGKGVIEASNGAFGDTAPGQVKKLRIDYVAGGRPLSRTVPEGDSIELSVAEAPAAVVEALAAATAKAAPAAKAALYRVLRVAGGPAALAAVRSGVADADAGVREAAIRVLCDWSSADALPDLEKLATTSGLDAKFKLLALRARLRLIPLQDKTAAERVADLEAAMATAERADEKRLALSALAAIPSVEALNAAVSHIADPALKDDAAAAAFALAESMRKGHRPAVAAAMQKIIAGGGPLAERAAQFVK